MNGAARQLGLAAAVAIVVGSLLGPGFFLIDSRPPAVMWIATGLLVLSGSVALATLSGKMPEPGGPYVFLRTAYGPLPAFVFGWTFFFVVAGGIIAWLSAVFAAGFPVGRGAARGIATLFIGILAWVNYRSGTTGARMQIVFVGLQVAALGAAMLPGARIAQAAPRLIDPLVCLPAFAGWAALSFASGHVRQPRLNMRLAYVLGLGICTLLFALPIDFDRVDPGRMNAVRTILAVGAANAWMMTAPWVSYAQARDHLFFRKFGDIHPRWRTPKVAILMLGVWAATLAITGLHLQLMAYGSMIAWFFYGMTVLSVGGWTRRWLVAPFLTLAFGYVALAAMSAPVVALNAVLMTLSGVAAYFIWRRFVR